MVKLYVEGAGSTDYERTQCRKAFASFLDKAEIANRPRTVPCGGREHAFGCFQTAVLVAPNDEVPILLVDSEGPVDPSHSNWQHLKARDNWDKPAGAADNQAFLMVQLMETWLLCDKEMLKKYFGKYFTTAPLKQWPALESVPKTTVLDALERATAGCPQKNYKKGKISFEMLENLDPYKVESACPHAKALLDHLRTL